MYNALIFLLMKFPFTKGLFDNEDLASWRAGFYLTTLEIILFVTIQGFFAIFNKNYSLPTSPNLAISLVLLSLIQIPNFYLIGSTKSRNRAIKSFKAYSLRRKIMSLGSVSLLIIAIIAMFIYMLYMTGLRSGVISSIPT